MLNPESSLATGVTSEVARATLYTIVYTITEGDWLVQLPVCEARTGRWSLIEWKMSEELDSLKQVEGANRALRSRLDLRGELLLALMILLDAVTGVLVVLQRSALWIPARYPPKRGRRP